MSEWVSNKVAATCTRARAYRKYKPHPGHTHYTAHSSGTNKTQFTQIAPNKKVIFTDLTVKKMYAQVNTH